MRLKSIVLLGLLLLIGWNADLSAQDEFAPGLGLAVKSSTNGIGGDAVFNFHRRMSLRLGYEKMALATSFNFEEESVEYDASVNYETGSMSLLFDYYLARHLFITAGAGYNLFHAVIDGKAASSMQYGDIQISKDKIGNFNFQIDPTMQISPYAGIGFGRTLGFNKKVGFSFEMGGFYQGSPDFTIASTGLLSPTSNPDQDHEARLEKQVSQYTIYPVLKFSLSYKIAKF
jgi:hypothetical protein